MDKQLFLDQFRQFINVHFDDNKLKSNDQIKISAGKRTLSDFLEFYNPWYIDKNGNIVGEIEKVLREKSIRALTVKNSASYPNLWDRAETIKPTLRRPVIIATDKGINETLIFDSNKTICRLIFKYKSPGTNIINVLEISGSNLQGLNTDFKALHQRI